MRTELMAGQYLDVLEQALGGGSVERALRVARFKSAKYRSSGPLQLGGRAGRRRRRGDGGVPPPTVSRSARRSSLRDDVLGVFGDPAETASRRATTCARASALP